MRCILLVLCVAVAIAAACDPQRIVGGTCTTIEQYPSLVSLLYSRIALVYWQTCAGTILNTRSILTNTHCNRGDQPIMWQARVGSTYANEGGIIHPISEIIGHPNFDWTTRDNNIGILRVATPFVYTEQVRAAFIASSTYQVGDNEAVWAAGWGTIWEHGPSSEELRHVQVWTVNQEICRNNYATMNWPVTDNMLCAGWLGVGGRDQCHGDCGGPLYHNNVVIGVYNVGNGCARPDFPQLNIRVSNYASWIAANA